MRWIVSFLFSVIIYAAMPIVGLLFFIPAILSKDWAFRACRTWSALVQWLLRVMLGLKTEVRGTPPTEACIVAAKHQSFLDILMIYNAVPRGKFIMKHEMIYMPIIGQYGMRLGCIPVKRGKRGAAIEKMKNDVKKGLADPGQLIIYPQGTRVAPGAKVPYKVGTGIIYEQLGQPVYPVAINVGHFWPKRGVIRKPGVAVVEFLEPIPPGLPPKEFMARLENVIEAKSDELLDEARRGT